MKNKKQCWLPLPPSPLLPPTPPHPPPPQPPTPYGPRPPRSRLLFFIVMFLKLFEVISLSTFVCRELAMVLTTFCCRLQPSIPFHGFFTQPSGLPSLSVYPQFRNVAAVGTCVSSASSETCCDGPPHVLILKHKWVGHRCTQSLQLLGQG